LGAEATPGQENLYPEVSLVVDVDGERDDEANEVDN